MKSEGITVNVSMTDTELFADMYELLKEMADEDAYVSDRLAEIFIKHDTSAEELD